jgi:DNA-binding YbaB/EbfC family protein
MQDDMLKAQQEVEVAEFEASSGGGAVTAKVSGKKNLLALTIAPEAVDPEDTEMLQDVIIAAVNEALRKADEAMESNMSKLTGGLSLGGLF